VLNDRSDIVAPHAKLLRCKHQASSSQHFADLLRRIVTTMTRKRSPLPHLESILLRFACVTVLQARISSSSMRQLLGEETPARYENSNELLS